MRLRYKKNNELVEIGDKINIGSEMAPEWVEVHYFKPPHKPSSGGKVTVKRGGTTQEYYASVLGVHWVLPKPPRVT